MENLVLQGGFAGILAIVLLLGGRALAVIGNRVADGIIRAFNELAAAQKSLLDAHQKAELEAARRSAEQREGLLEVAQYNRHKARGDLMVVQENILREVVEARDQTLAAIRREQRAHQEVRRDDLKSSVEGVKP